MGVTFNSEHVERREVFVVMLEFGKCRLDKQKTYI